MPEHTTDKKLMIRPVDLPIYGFPEEQESKAVVEHSETYQAALGAVGEARLLVQAGLGATERCQGDCGSCRQHWDRPHCRYGPHSFIPNQIQSFGKL